MKQLSPRRKTIVSIQLAGITLGLALLVVLGFKYRTVSYTEPVLSLKINEICVANPGTPVSHGVIQQYTVVLDEKQLGNDLTVFISVRLEHPKYGKEFAEAAYAHNNVAECYYIAGDVDYLLKIVTDSSKSLEIIHQDIKEMPGVAWTKTLYVLSTIKNDVSVLPGEL